jgi:hypothetical protein
MATWDDLLRQLQGLSLATPPANITPPSPQGTDIPIPNVSVQSMGMPNIGVSLPTSSGITAEGRYTPGTSNWMAKLGYQKQFAGGPNDPDPIGDLLTRNPAWSSSAYPEFRQSENFNDQSKNSWYQEFAKVPTGLNLDYNMQKMVPGYTSPDPFQLPTTPLTEALGSKDLERLGGLNVRFRPRKVLP